MRPKKAFMLYVSLVRREIRLGAVNASICRLERQETFANRSRRMARVASRDTREAMRLAAMLPITATAEQPSIASPQR